MPIFNKRKISQLPPELSDFPLLHSSSSNTSPRTISTIESATIISFEKHSDKKMWYVMEIETQQHQHHFTTKRTYYRIARRYVEFARLSQKLYKRFKTTKLRAGGYLPPKIKTNKLKIFPVSKELQNRRLEELNQFLKLLFRKQSIITESSTVFEFFKPRASDLKYAGKTALNDRKENKEGDDETTMMMPVDDPPAPAPETGAMPKLNNENDDGQHRKHDDERPTHGWKLLRCTSILSRSSASTSSISSFCTQAVHKLISPWHPSQHQQCRHHQRRNTDSNYWNNSTATLVGRKSFQDLREYYKSRCRKSRVIKKCQSTPGFIIRKEQHPLEETTNSSKHEHSNIDMLFLSSYHLTKSTNSISSMSSIPNYVSTMTENMDDDDVRSDVHEETEAEAEVKEEEEEGECSAIPILDDRYNNVIKFKIICDMDNIVIIRVSRIISLIELRERIMNKFAERHGLNISVGYDDFVLLYNDTNGNRCNARTVLENELVLPARVIRKEEDLKDLLQNKWKEFDRVALRCIIV